MKLMEVCVIRLLVLVFGVERRLSMQHDTYAKCTPNLTPDRLLHIPIPSHTSYIMLPPFLYQDPKHHGVTQSW